MDTVRWGLLSTANINRRVIPAIVNSKRGKLVAVASRNQLNADQYASTWNIPLSFDSYEALIGSELIDAIYISLPNHLHAEWSIRAMQGGKHVLCEKPLTLTITDCDRMIKTSHETGFVLSEAFMYLHHPQTKLAQDWINKGNLGEIVAVRSVFNFLLDRQNDIRRVLEYGGGALWDVGVYPVSFSNMIYGTPPQWVQGSQNLGETGIDETFVGTLGYSENRFSQIACSFQSPFYTYAEVIGTQGVLSFSRPFTGLDSSERKLCFINSEGEVYEIPVPDEYLYSGEIEDMHDAILDKKSPTYSLEKSQQNLATVLALYDSARLDESKSYLADR